MVAMVVVVLVLLLVVVVVIVMLLLVRWHKMLSRPAFMACNKCQQKITCLPWAGRPMTRAWKKDKRCMTCARRKGV